MLGLSFRQVCAGLGADIGVEEQWAELTFLTTNDYWESSIQATVDGVSYVKEASDPVSYSNNKIPCWRFEVDVKDARNIMYTNQHWLAMFKDAVDLGSDISTWHWTDKNVDVVQACKFVNGEWEILV